MSENFELAVATIRNLGNYFPYGGPEVRHTQILRTLLNEAGVACHMNVSGKGADILSKDFVVESKNDLLSSSVLHTLKGQVDGYVRQGNLQVLVVIYGDASRALLDELGSFTSNYYTVDIRVIVMGKVVNNGSTVSRPTTNNDSMSKWFNL